MNEKITTVAFHTYTRALMIKALLEAEGIDCFLSGENIVQPAVGAGVRIRVKESDVPKAIGVIERISREWGESKEKAIKRMFSARRILVPVDFSDYSLNACRYAIGIAERFKAEVKLFHAHFKPILDVPAYEGSHMYQLNYDKYFEELEIMARRKLIQLRDELQKEIDEKHLSHVTLSYGTASGFAEDAIIEYSHRYKPGLVVIGTHGVGQKTEGIFGSVALKLIDDLDIPLLAVPSTAPYTDLDHIRHLIYATDFDESDVMAIHKLLFFMRLHHMELHCVHISVGKQKPWDPVKMESLRSTFEDDFPGQKVNCAIIVSDNVLTGLEAYMRNHDVGIVAFTTHKRNLFTQFFTPSITRQALRRFNKPVFIFQTH